MPPERGLFRGRTVSEGHVWGQSPAVAQQDGPARRSWRMTHACASSLTPGAGAFKPARLRADAPAVGRSVIGFSAFVGLTVGSFVPELWGGSQLSLSSILFGAVGGVAGVWLGARVSGM